jgi:hypothetical protein
MREKFPRTGQLNRAHYRMTRVTAARNTNVIPADALTTVESEVGEKSGQTINELCASVHIHAHEWFCGQANTVRRESFVASRHSWLAMVRSVSKPSPVPRIVTSP